ncbi:hypothetical protein [Bradyrhizobium diazoefficiens]|uniref:hypothetical protein n=1 Tax=Bradyrhizobium diazoefficiens TaxID=1355477 RepID=UPI00272C5160|nr:hypothetical protein [Bradyrhizobium diazoefficiens]WLA61664.1 hypothetical protein QNN01_24280 [Bradyrhizobium diazoefficiens]
MKYFLAALVAIGLSIAATPSFAADARNVTVVNETGYAIKFLGFNAPDDGLDEWDNELDKVLQNQASTYVEFDDDDEGCVWNIRVDWQNYDESVLWKKSTSASSPRCGCATTPAPRPRPSSPNSFPPDMARRRGRPALPQARCGR